MVVSRKTLMPFFALWFFSAPILSTEETADPGAVYVLCMAIPLLLYALINNLFRLKLYHMSAILMFVMAIVSTVIGSYGNFDIPIICKYFLFVLFYITLTNYEYNGTDLKWMVKYYVIIATIVSFLIFLSFLGGYLHVDPDEPYAETQFLGRYSVGITGIYKNPNYLVSYINVAVFVIMFYISKACLNKIKLFFFIFLLSFLFLAVVLTGTRMGIVTFLLILILTYGLSLASKFKLYYIIPPIFIILVIYLLFANEIEDLFQLYLGTREMFSDDSRQEAWLFALNNILDNPVFGCGINSWDNLCKDTSYLEWLHNVFLEFLLNQGIVGLLLLLYILILGVNNIKKNDRSFVFMLLFVTALPMFFQNGVIAVNFWRFIIINRIVLNYSAYSQEGIVALFKVHAQVETH